MKRPVFAQAMIALLVFALALSSLAQSGRRTQNVPVEKPKPVEAEKEKPTGEAKKATPKESPNSDDKEPAVKLDTTLVTVPVVASDRNGLYVPDLKAAEFTIYEDDVRQEVAYFATVSEPFHVVLMIDTSASTLEKLHQIRRAAYAFVEQLQPADRVKIIAFDDTVRDLSGFTNNRETLNDAIEAIAPGQGTHMYDAFNRAMLALANVRRDRRAIVLFTDGVDNRSDAATYEENVREVEESGVIVYPIRYDTRAAVEALVRGQQQGGRLPNLGDIIKRPPIGGIPPTIPPTTPPTTRLPIPPVIVNRPRTSPNPNDPRDPRSRNPNDRRYPNDPRQQTDPNDPRQPYPNDPQARRNDDIISATLDNMYRTADSYLNDLAQKSGGKLLRADTLYSLPDAFAKIAAELRTQYALGYYPTNTARDGRYRKIQVKTSRKNTAIRARPGYQAPQAASSNGNQFKPLN